MFIASGSSLVELNNLAALQKGIYIVEFEMNGVRQHVKVIK